KILLYNGGIYTPEQAKQLLEQTMADGIGIARGAWGKPWLFKQIKNYLTAGTYQELNWEEIKKVMLEHASLALSSKGSHGFLDLRKHLAWYTKGRPGASQMRSKLVQINTLNDIKSILS
ncbi:MAG: tRNA-dihydrouridine synthase, partial [Patescibacteria group bacterium]